MESVPVPGGLSRTIAYGSIALWLGPKRPMHKTHRWTLFVRGPHNEDLSYMLRSVEFHLHESFPHAVRVVTQPPYQVTETGWGEFEARMVCEGRRGGVGPRSRATGRCSTSSTTPRSP